MPTLSKIIIPAREPLATEVARRVLDYLFSGEIKPGSRIPSERQLSEALGVNRPVVREALRTLSFLGLLDIRQSAGTYFVDPYQDLLFTIFELSLIFGQHRLVELIETRIELEVVIAGLAASRRTADQIKRLDENLETLRRAKGVTFIEADYAFHATIAEAAHNDVMRDMLKGVRTMVRKWLGTHIRYANPATTAIAFAEHVPIFVAIRDQNVDAARAAMTTHMVEAKKRLASAVDLSKTTRAVLARLNENAAQSQSGHKAVRDRKVPAP